MDTGLVVYLSANTRNQMPLLSDRERALTTVYDRYIQSPTSRLKTATVGLQSTVLPVPCIIFISEFIVVRIKPYIEVVFYGKLNVD